MWLRTIVNMFLKCVVVLCIYFLLLASAAKNEDAENNNCKRNEVHRKYVSCEKFCSDGNEHCKFMTRCVCSEDYYRNERTGECVEKAKCSLYPEKVVKEKAIKTFGTGLEKTAPLLPDTMGEKASKMGKDIKAYHIVKSTIK